MSHGELPEKKSMPSDKYIVKYFLKRKIGLPQILTKWIGRNGSEKIRSEVLGWFPAKSLTVKSTVGISFLCQYECAAEPGTGNGVSAI
jgi:hypothetical protein